MKTSDQISQNFGGSELGWLYSSKVSPCNPSGHLRLGNTSVIILVAMLIVTQNHESVKRWFSDLVFLHSLAGILLWRKTFPHPLFDYSEIWKGRINSWFFPPISESCFVLAISLWTSGFLYTWYVLIPYSHYYCNFWFSVFCPVGYNFAPVSLIFDLIAFLFFSLAQYVPDSSCTLFVPVLESAILPRCPSFLNWKWYLEIYQFGQLACYCYWINRALGLFCENMYFCEKIRV